MLLRITAPTSEEADFYRLRLCEYRWTLGVSHKNAAFMGFALQSLDNATALHKHVPAKPGIEELMAATKAAPPRLPTTAHGTYDEAMMEAGTGTSSSVISGLASPATSVSDIEDGDASMPPL
jgi:hypothetical protein